MCMTRDIYDTCQFTRPTIPFQIAKIIAILNRYTYIGLRIQYWNHNRIMSRDKINDAYDTYAADNAHIFPYSVFSSLIEGNEIVLFIKTILNDLSRNQPIT